MFKAAGFTGATVTVAGIRGLVTFTNAYLLREILVFFSGFRLPLCIGRGVVHPMLGVRLLRTSTTTIGAAGLVVPTTTTVPAFSGAYAGKL